MYESKMAGGIDGRGKKTLGCFLHETDGFAITLTIISLPFFLAIAAWVIDASRVGNLHTDLQNGVDAMALAGARELDGRDDAIPRAQLAIAELNSNDAFFAGGGDGVPFGSRIDMVYDPADAPASTVVVRFLKSLPGSDDIPIDLAVHEVSGTAVQQSNEARYAHVVAKNQSVQTIFPLGFAGRQTVVVNTEAVATYTAAACDVTPLFICNPFEGSANPDFHQNFADGNLYARQMTMNIESGTAAGPGNFGFLRTNGSGGDVLGEALATGSPGVCYEEDTLETEPGATVGQAFPGINTRMGLYKGSYGSSTFKYRPDKNVRKGQKQTGSCPGGGTCSVHCEEDNPLNAMAFPEGASVTVIGGGTISSADWDLDLYWDISHGGYTTAPLPADDPSYLPPPVAPATVSSFRPSLPPTATALINVPSRYDVYQYEIQTIGMVADAAPNTETGAPACYTGPSLPPDDSERRVIFAAVIDCIDQQDELYGASGDPEAVAFARMFMTKPGLHDGSDKKMYLEVIDITGSGGLGTVELFLREEAELVR